MSIGRLTPRSAIRLTRTIRKTNLDIVLGSSIPKRSAWPYHLHCRWNHSRPSSSPQSLNLDSASSSDPNSSPFTAFTRPDIVTPPKVKSKSKRATQASDPTTSANMRVYASHYPDAPLAPPCSIFHYNFPLPSLRSQENGKPSGLPDEFDTSLPAYVDAASGETYTRREIHLKSRQVGLGLLQHFTGSSTYKPIKPSDRPVILIFSPNSMHYPLLFFGAQSCLFITTLANAGYTSTELAHQIVDSGATGAFIHPDLVSTYEGALKIVAKKSGGAEQAGRLEKGTWLVARRKELKGAKGKFESFEKLMDGVPESKAGKWEGATIEKGGEHETALLCYSSGTTGLAKGVMTTHYNLSSVQSMVRPINFKLSPNSNDSVLGVLPFYHIYGLVVVMLYAFTQGVPVIVLPRFEPTAFLGAVQKYKITYANIVPPIVVFLANAPVVEEYDLSSLKVCMSGAAPLGDGLTKKAVNRVGFAIVQGYGLTETSPITHMLQVEEATAHPGSIGRLISNMSARIIDIDGNDVEPGMPGEIIFKGPNVMKGYLKNEKATKGTFTADGWYKTGDIAQIDKDGFYFIVDRLKELIKYKGFQVPPADLEAVLLTHPKVADVGVVGIMDEEQATEVPLAYIVPAGGLESLKSEKEKEALSKEIVQWTAKTVSNHKQLRGGVVLIDVIPKSAAGKILRRELRLHAAKNVKLKKPAAKL